jgi:hypothetical protein
MEANEQTIPQDVSVEPESKKKLPAKIHIMCGWPLALVAVGGLIGGALGGGAYGINMAIFKSNLPVPAKVVLNVLTGVVAIGLWLAIGIAINISAQ